MDTADGPPAAAPRTSAGMVETSPSATTAPADGVRDDAPSRGDLAYEYLERLLATYAAAALHDPGREQLRERLVTGYLPVARNVARRYAGRGEPLDDLEQVGCIGLLKAIDRYDPDLGHHFLSFAIPTITGEIRRHFRDRTWSMRVPRALKELHAAIPTAVARLSEQLHRAPRPSEIAAHLNIPTADVLEALQAGQAYRAESLDKPPTTAPESATFIDNLGHTDARFELFTNSHALAPHLAALPPRERSILIMRFYQDMTQTQIAEKIGVSQMHVSRLLAASLTRLREAVDTDPDTGALRPAGGGEDPARGRTTTV